MFQLVLELTNIVHVYIDHTCIIACLVQELFS